MPVPNSSVDTSGAGGETSVGTRISLKNSPDGPRNNS